MIKCIAISENKKIFNVDPDTSTLPSELLQRELYKQQLVDIRLKRNSLLAECDYIMLSDVPLTDEKKVEFIEYRQQLRDLPNQIESSKSFDLDSIVWPEKPSLK